MLDLYAGGMSTRDIAAHLQRLYGVQVGRDTISRVTDAVLEDIAAWRARPLEAVYPIVYFDALHGEGDRRPLGPHPRLLSGRRGHLSTATAKRSGSGGRTPRARSSGWPSSTTSHRRGVQDVLIACVDGLTGFPDAIEAVFPQSLGADLHRAPDPLLDALRQLPRPPHRWPTTCGPIYTAANADAAARRARALRRRPGAPATR